MCQWVHMTMHVLLPGVKLGKEHFFLLCHLLFVSVALLTLSAEGLLAHGTSGILEITASRQGIDFRSKRLAKRLVIYHIYPNETPSQILKHQS